ncbi:MAG: thymidine kinase [Flavobacteriales bacterium]|nr:thymidine kinase [Flavobacteriales bacterium]|tara:strand:+ start:23765 stop:24304 length:540 start_codon:yes stop_codon:yes gene_type:complete
MKGIEVITGCMFSGKTTALFSRLKSSRDTPLLVKPLIDDRESGNIISTHSGIKLKAIRVNHLSDIFNLISKNTILGIDEAQFFPNTIIRDLKLLKNINVKVIIAGLDKDYLNNNFEIMNQIISLSDHVTRLYAECKCGHKANFSYRKNQLFTDQVLIGDKDVYEALCENCFMQKQKNKS